MDKWEKQVRIKTMEEKNKDFEKIEETTNKIAKKANEIIKLEELLGEDLLSDKAKEELKEQFWKAVETLSKELKELADDKENSRGSVEKKSEK